MKTTNETVFDSAVTVDAVGTNVKITLIKETTTNPVSIGKISVIACGEYGK